MYHKIQHFDTAWRENAVKLIAMGVKGRICVWNLHVPTKDAHERLTEMEKYKNGSIH